MSGQISITKSGAIATLVIDNEAKRNALSQSMWEGMAQAVAQLEADSDVRVVIVRGAGDKAFSAGADISEFTEMAKDPQRLAANNKIVQSAQAALEELSKPTIAMIYGACVGGGCGLSLACDFRFAADDAKFAITPAKLGLLYSVRDTRRLHNLVGPAVTRSMLYTGKLLKAGEAMQVGLLTEVSAAEDLQQQVEDFAAQLAEGSQYSLRGIKAVLGKLEGYSQITDAEVQALFDNAFTSEDCVEGTAAFLARRKPTFTFK